MSNAEDQSVGEGADVPTPGEVPPELTLKGLAGRLARISPDNPRYEELRTTLYPLVVSAEQEEPKRAPEVSPLYRLYGSIYSRIEMGGNTYCCETLGELAQASLGPIDPQERRLRLAARRTALQNPITLTDTEAEGLPAHAILPFNYEGHAISNAKYITILQLPNGRKLQFGYNFRGNEMEYEYLMWVDEGAQGGLDESQGLPV